MKVGLGLRVWRFGVSHPCGRSTLSSESYTSKPWGPEAYNPSPPPNPKLTADTEHTLSLLLQH